LATAGQDRTARLWNVRTGRELMRMGHDEDVNSISFSPDGKILATGSDSSEVQLWDITRTGQGLELYQDGPVEQIVLSHNGAYVAVITSESSQFPPVPVTRRRKTVKVFDTNTGQQMFSLLHTGALSKVAFSDNDQSLFIALLKKIERWSWQTTNHKENEYVLADQGFLNSIDFSGDGRYAVAAVYDENVKLVDLSGKQPIKVLPFKGSPSAIGRGKVTISANGQRVILQDSGGKHFMWDMESNSVTDLDQGSQSGNLRVSPDGRYLASSPSGPRTVKWKIYDILQSKTVFDGETSRGLKNVTFSKDGQYVALAYRQNIVDVCQLRNQTCTSAFAPESLSTLFAFSNDSNYFAAGGGGLVQIWSLGANREVTRLEYNGSLRGLGFSSDNKYVISGSTDRSVRLALLRIGDLINMACERTGGLTKEEWEEFFKGEPYRKTCPSPK